MKAVNEYGLTEDIVKKLPDLHRAGSELPSKHAGDLRQYGPLPSSGRRHARGIW